MVIWIYSKPCLKRPLSERPKLVFNTNYRLMEVKSIAECSKGSILQYFRPSLSYCLSLRSLFCLFLNGCLRQVLLYILSVLCLGQDFWGTQVSLYLNFRGTFTNSGGDAKSFKFLPVKLNCYAEISVHFLF